MGAVGGGRDVPRRCVGRDHARATRVHGAQVEAVFCVVGEVGDNMRSRARTAAGDRRPLTPSNASPAHLDFVAGDAGIGRIVPSKGHTPVSAGGPSAPTGRQVVA